MKNSDNFHISAQNIDCECSLEPPQRDLETLILVLECIPWATFVDFTFLQEIACYSFQVIPTASLLYKNII